MLERPWIAEKLGKTFTEELVASYRNMDDPSIIEAIYELALEAAEQQVKVEHFFPKRRRRSNRRGVNRQVADRRLRSRQRIGRIP